MLQVAPLNYRTVTCTMRDFLPLNLLSERCSLFVTVRKAVFLQITWFISKLEPCHHPVPLL